MPALLKAFLEQVMRPGVALEDRKHGFPRALLADRSARIVVTMGMPALIYRWYFRAHGVRGLERSVLKFAWHEACPRDPVGDGRRGEQREAAAPARPDAGLWQSAHLKRMVIINFRRRTSKAVRIERRQEGCVGPELALKSSRFPHRR
jgi:hypothetical protein